MGADTSHTTFNHPKCEVKSIIFYFFWLNLLGRKGYHKLNRMINFKRIKTTSKAKFPTNLLPSQSKRSLFVHEKGPKEIADGYKQDYNSNNSCSASPNITEIYCFQGCHITVATVVIVPIKILSELIET